MALTIEQRKATIEKLKAKHKAKFGVELNDAAVEQLLKGSYGGSDTFDGAENANWALEFDDLVAGGDPLKVIEALKRVNREFTTQQPYRDRFNAFFDKQYGPEFKGDPANAGKARTLLEEALADPKKWEQMGSKWPVSANTPKERIAAMTAAAAKKPDAKSGTPPAAVVAPAVAKSAEQPVTPPQKSIAEQQAEDIRNRGGQTARDLDSSLAASIKDPNSAFNAAMARGRHADAHAMNMRAGKYANIDPDAFIPETVGVKGKGAVTYRERAYGKHFATPALVEAKKKGDFAQPFYRGGNWVGNNIVTGEFKDAEGNIWGNEGQFRNSQLGERGMVESDEMPSFMDEKFSWEDPQRDPIKDAVRMGGLPDHANSPNDIGPNMKGYDQQKFDFLRAKVRANALGDTSLDNMGSLQYFDPHFLHWSKGNAVNDLGRDPSAGYAPDTSNAVPSSRWAGGSDTERLFLPALPNTTLQQDINARNNTWTPQKGGLKNGVWMSPADSEPQAGGNYGPQVNTWTPQTGGMYNGSWMSRGDSEPAANGYYGIPQYIRRQNKK